MNAVVRKGRGMCEHCLSYTYLDITTFGGTTGDYALVAMMDSCKWMEYRLISIAAASAGDVQVLLSTKSAPTKQLTYDNTTSFNTDGFLHVRPVYVPKGTTYNADGQVWERIANSQHKLFARIDATANSVAYIAVQFRARILDVIPGPTPSVHPDLGHQMNIERAERIEKRLKQLGMPAERLVDK